MKNQSVARDERTTTVENTSYRWAYLLLSFGLLVSVAYRAFAWHESSWDLLALVLLGGLVATFYQGIHRVLSRRWALVAVVTVLVAGGIALAITLLR
jgi:hypothetical protein